MRKLFFLFLAPLLMAPTEQATMTLNINPAGPPGQTPAIEARCAELGSDCVCSEPLRFDQLKEVAPPGQLAHDPEDSEGPGAKECAGGNAVTRLAGDSPFRVVTGSSAGLPQVSRVLLHEKTATTGSGRVEGNTQVDFTGGTFCSRVYYREDPQNPVPPPTAGGDDLKFQSYTGGSGSPTGSLGLRPGHMAINVAKGKKVWDWQSNPGPAADCASGISLDGANPIDTDPHCSRNGWCFFEICYDHNPDNTLTVRAIERALNDPANPNDDLINTFGPCRSQLSQPSVQTGTSVRFFRGHCDRDDDGKDPRCFTKRFVSHAMMAIRNQRDPNFWIGAAQEVEN